MRAAVLTAPERIEIRDVETPVPGRGELLVRLKACGICTLEQRLFTGEMKMPYPLVPGHEASGEVAAAGPEVPPGFAAGHARGPGPRAALRDVPLLPHGPVEHVPEPVQRRTSGCWAASASTSS